VSRQRRGPAGTPALLALTQAGVDFVVHEFDPDAATPDVGYGRAAALALGLDERIVFKTLMATVDGRPTVAVVPVAGNLSLKALAAAQGGKRGDMMDVATAQRLTGYVVGGISPFGQRKRLPTVIDDSALALSTVLVSGGRRCLDVEISPTALVELLDAVVAPLRSG
jgi:Cys-tRNA(Pro)/Cys-tRNA(Cys) deacylase